MLKFNLFELNTSLQELHAALLRRRGALVEILRVRMDGLMQQLATKIMMRKLFGNTASSAKPEPRPDPCMRFRRHYAGSETGRWSGSGGWCGFLWSHRRAGRVAPMGNHDRAWACLEVPSRWTARVCEKRTTSRDDRRSRLVEQQRSGKRILDSRGTASGFAEGNQGMNLQITFNEAGESVLKPTCPGSGVYQELARRSADILARLPATRIHCFHVRESNNAQSCLAFLFLPDFQLPLSISGCSDSEGPLVRR